MLTKEKALEELQTYISQTFKSKMESEIIQKIFLEKQTLDKIGQKYGYSKEYIRQIKSAWIRRKKLRPGRLTLLLAPFIKEFRWDRRFCEIDQNNIALLKIVFAKNQTNFEIQDNFIVDKAWIDFKNTKIHNDLKNKGCSRFFKFFSISREVVFDNMIFKNPAGFVYYSLLGKNNKSIKIEEIINQINNLFPGNTTRALGSLLERKNLFLKVSLNEFKITPSNINDIAQEISGILENNNSGEFGKKEFAELTKELNHKYDFHKHEAYYILRRYFPDRYSFSTGNRMVISKVGKVKTIDEILKFHFGEGPSLIDIKYAHKNFHFTNTTLINTKCLYSYNSYKYLYFNSSLFPEIKKIIMKTLDDFNIDFISYSRMRKKLLENTEGTKYSHIFSASSLTKILRHSLKDEQQIELIGSMVNLSISIKEK